jgi:hypothetical protein
MTFGKHFFKFVLGFTVLLLFGVLGLLVTNYYDIVNNGDDVNNIGATTRVEIN